MTHLRLLVLLGVTVAAGVAAVTLEATHDDARPAVYRGSTLPDRYELPGFSLRDQDGALVTTKQLRGHVVVLTFLDTDCKESCPIIAGVVGRAVRQLTQEERQQVRAVAVTVNPVADTPPRVRRFLRERRALGELDFLLGSLAELEPLWHEFKILSAHQTGNADIHSAPVRIYDRDGVWVTTQHVGADLSVTNLLHDVRLALDQ